MPIDGARQDLKAPGVNDLLGREVRVIPPAWFVNHDLKSFYLLEGIKLR
jgi:hypothetical protein